MNFINIAFPCKDKKIKLAFGFICLLISFDMHFYSLVIFFKMFTIIIIGVQYVYLINHGISS